MNLTPRIVLLSVMAMQALSMASDCAAAAEARVPITGVITIADGQQVIDVSQNGIRIRRWSDLQIESRLLPSCSQIHDVKLSPDESLLLVAGGEPGECGVVVAYSWPKLQLLWHREFSGDMVYALDISVDGQTIAAAAHDHRVYLLNPATGDIRSSLSGHSRPVTDVLFLSDGRTAVSASLDQTMRVWNVPDRNIDRSLNNHTQAVMGLALRSTSGGGLPMIASAGEDKTVRLWQPTIGRLVRFQRFDSPVNVVAFDATGNFVLAGCRDGSLRIVNVDSLEERVVPDVVAGWINCLAAHPRETVAVVGGSDGMVRKVILTAESTVP